MVNIVIATHGELAEALLQATEMIAGPVRGLYAVSLLPGESPEAFEQKIEELLRKISEEDTLILTDMVGGTPHNVAARQARKTNVACVAGVNLPMLLELVVSCDYGEIPIADLAAYSVQAGRDGIKTLGPLLRAP